MHLGKLIIITSDLQVGLESPLAVALLKIFLNTLILSCYPSYNPYLVTDTTHALNIFEHKNMAKTFQPQLLFTLDMVSLYTSIHHGDGLRALSFFLDHCPPEACYPSTPGSTG